MFGAVQTAAPLLRINLTRHRADRAASRTGIHRMKRRQPTPAPPPKTLSEQKTDFTAEGAPPPGQVGPTVPVGSDEAPAPCPPAAAKGSAARPKR
jgi:hypothetical protein